MKNFLCLMLPIFLSGCYLPYPAYRVIEPKTTFQLMNDAGNPVAEAKLNLITIVKNPYGDVNFSIIHTELSNGSGYVSFEGKTESQWKTFPSHGVYYEWKLCIEKEGYANFIQFYKSASEFEKLTSVVLTKGKSYSCED